VIPAAVIGMGVFWIFSKDFPAGFMPSASTLLEVEYEKDCIPNFSVVGRNSLEVYWNKLDYRQ